MSFIGYTFVESNGNTLETPAIVYKTLKSCYNALVQKYEDEYVVFWIKNAEQEIETKEGTNWLGNWEIACFGRPLIVGVYIKCVFLSD